MAVKLIIQVADIHIRNVLRHDEYAQQLGKFIEKVKEIASPYKKEEVRIVICGDLVHQKNNISNELMSFTSAFIRDLEEIAQVMVFSGNHDLMESNTTRTDTITALFETAAFQNAYFLDNMLDYDSGYIVDDNVTWALYSIFADYRKPNIEEARKENPDNIVIGLYHGTVVGSVLPKGYTMDSGNDSSIFDGCDIVMAGHIHKRQELFCGKTSIVYPGSLIQQDFGESIDSHGFCVWNIEDKSHKFIDIPTDYGLYDIAIENINDLDEGKEKLLNE